MTQQQPTRSPLVLRAEFVQCAEDSRTVVHAAWQVVYIFLSAILLGLALVAAQLISRDTEQHDWLTFGLVLAVGIVGVLMALGLILIQRRQHWLAAITYERMRWIERELGMRKNIYIDMLDHWCDKERWNSLSPDDQEFLLGLHKVHRRPMFYGGTVIQWVAGLTIFGWLGLVLAELGIAVWNQAHG